MQTEMGLTPRTRELLANPPPPDYTPGKYRPIGVTNFLREYTSLIVWESYRSIAQRAAELDPMICEFSLHSTLCALVVAGEFEKKKESNSRTVYRRLERTTPLPKSGRKRGEGKKKRTVTNESW